MKITRKLAEETKKVINVKKMYVFSWMKTSNDEIYMNDFDGTYDITRASIFTEKEALAVLAENENLMKHEVDVDVNGHIIY
jgi:hypothetical protein